jgi:hypothetical protein
MTKTPMPQTPQALQGRSARSATASSRHAGPGLLPGAGPEVAQAGANPAAPAHGSIGRWKRKSRAQALELRRSERRAWSRCCVQRMRGGGPTSPANPADAARAAGRSACESAAHPKADAARSRHDQLQRLPGPEAGWELPKEHENWAGLGLTFENRAGSTRTAADGSWSVPMQADYGYVKRTIGADTKPAASPSRSTSTASPIRTPRPRCG